MSEKELTEKQQLFLEALFSSEAKGDIRVAMDIAGYSKETRSSEVLKGLSDEIVTKSKEFLAENSGKAAWELLDALQNSSQAGVANKLKAIEAILNRAGVKAKEETSVSVPQSGLVILPAKSIRIENDENPEG